MNRAVRLALLGDIVRMSFETLRANLLRSALTILGVVIGVTSIVAMTAMIRGFGDQMRALFQQMGTETVYVSKMSITSFAAGKKFWDLMKRPDVSEADARAIKEQAPSAETVTYHLGEGPGANQQRFGYGNVSTKPMGILGADSNWLRVNFLKIAQGRFLSDYEVQHRRPVVVLGDAPAAALFPNTDPIGKQVRYGPQQYTVVGVIEKRPSLLGAGVDDFGVIPSTTYDKHFRPPRWRGYLMRFMVISAVPREGASRDDLMHDIESVMRSRHRLKLDEENDFDMLTSDSLMNVVEQLTRAVVLALVVISSIALTVGGIGVMAIMSISVTERTREIGVRRAIGATKSGILWQFLIEAVVLTSLGGLLGSLAGASIGVGVNVAAGFPLALPWWSFALGIGFSAAVGLFFGLFPAFKAAKLDPIEALRHE
jgi:putative ABC transport system permease protein